MNDWERAVRALGQQQYGLVARWQLRELGVDRHTIRRRIAAGAWEPAGKDVFRIAGSPPSGEQLLLAAVLSQGQGAVASHEAAAWLWGLPGFDARPAVARARPNGGPVERVGHRPRLLPEHHKTAVRGIPCTTLPRTLFDLAARLPHGRMVRLVDTVTTRSPAMLPALHAMLEELAARGRAGITLMRQILAERPVGARVPASGVEARFEEICRNAGIRDLERQLDVGGQSWLGRVDYVQRRTRTLFEVDSRLHHTSPTDVARDRARDEAMLAAGWRAVVRIAEEDIWRRPWVVVEQVRAADRAAA